MQGLGDCNQEMSIHHWAQSENSKSTWQACCRLDIKRTTGLSLLSNSIVYLYTSSRMLLVVPETCTWVIDIHYHKSIQNQESYCTVLNSTVMAIPLCPGNKCHDLCMIIHSQIMPAPLLFLLSTIFTFYNSILKIFVLRLSNWPGFIFRECDQAFGTLSISVVVW